MKKQEWQNLVSNKGWWKAYVNYLSSKSWQEKREKRLIIDIKECRLCGSQDDLQIHHKPTAYKKIPHENVFTDLITLCKICHEVITSSIRQRRYSDRQINPHYMDENPERQLTSYGMENSTIQVNECESLDSAQWRFSQSDESFSEETEGDFWKEEEDRSRFRGIG